MNVANDDVRELELELVRIRAEALAARLEARAAEIELMLRRSTRGFGAGVGVAAIESAGIESAAVENTGVGYSAFGNSAVEHASVTHASVTHASVGSEGLTGLRITSWEGLMQAAQHLIDDGQVAGEIQAGETSFESEKVVANDVAANVLAASEDSPLEEYVSADPKQVKIEDVMSQETDKPASSTTDSPKKEESSEPSWSLGQVMDGSAKSLADGAGKKGAIDVAALTALAGEAAKKRIVGAEAASAYQALKQVGEEAVGGQSEKTPAKRRPAAWIFSVLAHAAVLLILAGVTLSVPDPKDQMALSASAVQPSEEQVETVELQQTEQPETESSEASETLTTVNPVGEIAAAVVDVTGPGMPDVVASPGESLGQMLSASVSAGATSNVSTMFFGASGGGNHFVYLVDSSGSMDNVSRDGFDVARAEVLRAVESLDEKQRFYVIFFGEETMRMRLSNPNEPELRAVYATDANKRALRRWAMTIQMQPGKWPEEALEFAFTLRPDCIFLLTDGAMPDYVPDFVKRNNIVETLLDGPKPRSLIHTIGFHNAEGEAILSKIAKENGGKYHFVPANGGSRK